MTLPILTAVAPRWEVELAGALSRSAQVHVVRRCADVAELLGVAAAGLGRVAVVSSDLRALDRAVLGLMPFGEQPPEIWTAAHGPRMLRLTGRKADGWLPTKLSPAEYGRSLGTIRETAEQAGRDPDGFRIVPFGSHPTPGKLDHFAAIGVTEVVCRIPSVGRDEALAVLDDLVAVWVGWSATGG